MDKYSVQQEQDDPKVKTAAQKGVCPKCGSQLEKTANVSKCPTHGTEPFEKRRDDAKGDS